MALVIEAVRQALEDAVNEERIKDGLEPLTVVMGHFSPVDTGHWSS